MTRLQVGNKVWISIDPVTRKPLLYPDGKQEPIKLQTFIYEIFIEIDDSIFYIVDFKKEALNDVRENLSHSSIGFKLEELEY
jgi:hypothetical protein